MWRRARDLSGALTLGLWASAAQAGGTTVGLGVAGGFEITTRQPVLALDLSFHPDQMAGFSFVGRLQLGAGFYDERPYGLLQAGFAGVVPADDATVRIGVLAHTMIYAADYRLPLQIGGEPEAGTFGHVGFLPGALVLAEVGFRREGERGPARWAVGIKAGAAPGVAVIECADPTSEEVCLGQRVRPIGGFTARLLLHEGFFLDATLGPTASLAIGYGWPLPERVREKRAEEEKEGRREIPDHLRPD